MYYLFWNMVSDKLHAKALSNRGLESPFVLHNIIISDITCRKSLISVSVTATSIDTNRLIVEQHSLGQLSLYVSLSLCIDSSCYFAQLIVLSTY